MRSTSQSGMIADKIMNLLGQSSVYDKDEIITIVHVEMKVPRATVRRVKRDLILTLQEYIRVLTNNAS